tara:strand:- start:820 stop:1260 length:441 start_codon:yes stop_codon:yes gene_type:complete
MSKYKVEVTHLPAPKLYMITGASMRANIIAAFPTIPPEKIDIDDSYYFYCGWDDWGKVLLKAQEKLPTYMAERRDCDWFAYYVAVMVTYWFAINTCIVVEGYANGVRHKWNMVFDGDSFTQLESQQREVYYEPDSPEYIPDEAHAF